MNLSLDVSSIIALLGSASAIGVSWGIARAKSEAVDRYIQALEKDVWREVGKLRDWRHEHDTDSGRYRMNLEKDIAGWRSHHLADEAERREQIERRFGDVNATLAQFLEQTKGIKETLDSINRKVSRIEESKQ